ncbi:virulence factor SrfB [Achromobacter insuavis]|uniref:virulence factor SrfB n=3 Tax=Pseudomonadati TaxID=3379134 RepID=UPI0029D7BB9A|nr:virulence factor SrfB [Achromobacter sp.]
MLPPVDTYDADKDNVELFGNTGVQFLDLACALPDLKREPEGEFCMHPSGRMPIRLYVPEDGKPGYEDRPGSFFETKAAFSLPMQESLALFDGFWLPLPFFRYKSDSQFDRGPKNWARLRLVKLAEADANGNTHRVTLAFDTRTRARDDARDYIEPYDEDMETGALFRLAFNLHEMQWFLDEQEWVIKWLESIFRERRDDLENREIERALAKKEHIAHYLNLLSLMRESAPTTRSNKEQKDKVRIKLPRIKVLNMLAPNGDGRKVLKGGSVPVDLVLDVGNSRTCGILIEEHKQNDNGLNDYSFLTLRDMTSPERVYHHPFESRVEFAPVSFGKDDLSLQGGRDDAFVWVSMARVGTEANNLAARKEGTEGSTGLSSPKRYLWDAEDAYESGWRPNASTIKGGAPEWATLGPLKNLIDEKGIPLYGPCPLYQDEETSGFPAFEAHYTRSSLMGFMLNEVFAQAVSQINSWLYRSRKKDRTLPRYLRAIILTVPPSMPQVERGIFKQHAQRALSLLWKSMGWHTGDGDPVEDAEDEKHDLFVVALPKIVIKWDEATCGQLVYLYTEVVTNFSGYAEEFFDTLARREKRDRECITVASLDIGGGTTDLVITDYRLDRSLRQSANSFVPITPTQRFRDGFKVAGDDIVLEVIRKYVLPYLETALKAAGAKDGAALMDVLCGSTGDDERQRLLRQQLTLQCFYPLGLGLLKEYENYDPEQPAERKELTIGEWLRDKPPLSAAVRGFVGKALNEAAGRPVDFDLAGVPLVCDPLKMHFDFLTDNLDICNTLRNLCEIVNYFDCDVLLLTGRPSVLPGVQAVIRKAVPLPPGRLVPMHNYRTGDWFPFRKAGCIDDPKTTASVGAMVIWLCENNRIPTFKINTGTLRPKPLVRYFGEIGNDNMLKLGNVLFSDIRTRQSEDGKTSMDQSIELPVDEEGVVIPFKMENTARLGYRQLKAERWPATPMYVLGFDRQWEQDYKRSQESNPNKSHASGRVYFKVAKPTEQERKAGLISDRLLVAKTAPITDDGGTRPEVRLQLNTQLRIGKANFYWLDSGSVKG